MGIQDRFKILSGISLFGFCSAVLLTRFQPAVFGLALQQLRIGDSDICKPNTIFLYRLFDDPASGTLSAVAPFVFTPPV